MKRTCCLAVVFFAMSGATASGQEATHLQQIPHLQQNGQALQLMVDGAPYIALNGELHNSSPSSPAYMAAIWDKLAKNNLRTVIGVASWELVEPTDGHFDFTAVDDQIRQTHARGIRLVLIWFGGYKNAESRYAPSWVRRDETRFPRAVRSNKLNIPGPYAHYFTGPAVSVFSNQFEHADARAFAALMRHIKEVDRAHTVITIQVENETGLLGDTRDRSALADAAWSRQVPAELMAYLKSHRDTLRPQVRHPWEQHGFRETGTWAEVFGSDAAAEEIFMAWSFSSYVNKIAKAGAAEYPLPMYANAWLGPQAISPVAGMYPSGGPVAGMMDVWKAAAPAIAILGPDTYVDDFAGTMAAYHRPDNPIFIPETRLDVGNLFVALGQYNAISFSPFGIDSAPDDNDVFKAYGVLNGMVPQIAKAQAEGHIWGAKLGKDGPQTFKLGGYDVVVSVPVNPRGPAPGGAATGPAPANSHALLLNTGEDEFLIVGRGVNVQFTQPNTEVEIDHADEGTFKNGVWTVGRRLNGDEQNMLFPGDSLRIVMIKLLRRPPAVSSAKP